MDNRDRNEAPGRGRHCKRPRGCRWGQALPRYPDTWPHVVAVRRGRGPVIRVRDAEPARSAKDDDHSLKQKLGPVPDEIPQARRTSPPRLSDRSHHRMMRAAAHDVYAARATAIDWRAGQAVNRGSGFRATNPYGDEEADRGPQIRQIATVASSLSLNAATTCLTGRQTLLYARGR